MIILGLLLFVVSLAMSAALSALAVRVSPRLGYVDMPSARKTHKAPMPYGGGVAVFVTVAVMVAGAMALGWWWRRSGVPQGRVFESLPPILDYLTPVKLREVGIILAVGLGVFLLGLVDDFRALSPRVKLAAQVVLFSALPLSGISVSVFLEEGGLAAGTITVLWLVFITNAFNLLDHHDGVCGAVATVVSANFLLVAAQTQQWFICAFLVVMLGAFLGFLSRNLPPARLYAGDAGSLSIGYLLGVLSVEFTFVTTGEFTLLPFALPFLIFAVPAFDTLGVMAIRFTHRRPLFEPDKNHFAHRLRDLGLTARETLAAITALTLALSITSTLLVELGDPGRSVLGLQAVILLGLIVILERAARRTAAERGKNEGENDDGDTGKNDGPP